MVEENSILKSVKLNLNIDSEYDAFDPQILTHINSVFFTLNQLGVGPKSTFMITDDTKTWSEFIGDQNIAAVKSYMYLKVRLLFDPPTTSFALESMNKMATEYEWRLNVEVDVPPAESSPTITFSQALWDLSGGKDFPDEAPVGAYGIDTLNGYVWRKE